VAICDVRLPHVDGLTLLHRVHEESPTSSVILMSAFGSVAEAVGAMKDSAAHYLVKPFVMAVLLDLLESIGQQRHAVSVCNAAEGAEPSVLVGATPKIVRLREMIGTIAWSDASVVLTGESGTGKELAAREIHRLSPRADKPLVTINCAAFPDTLFEAELFGHEKGAFTGAESRREGRFGAANNSTLFLDELAEMPLAAQAKLLRVLEDGIYQRLGSNDPIPVNVRIVSATNVDVDDALAQGRLRTDIYHRLKVFHLELPPLRERLADIPLLIRHLYAAMAGPDRPPLSVTPRAWAALQQYDYPGNVRELKHILQHATILSGDADIDLCHLPSELRGDATTRKSPGSLVPLAQASAEFEGEYLMRALRQCNGHRARTAELLGVSRKTLWHKLKNVAGEK
jgi:DNA-binding NtrC family response regulator